MAIEQSGGGWNLGPIGGTSQSTMAPMQLTPSQIAQIHQTTAAMQQGPQPTQQPLQPLMPQSSPQQSAMLSGLFGGLNGGMPNYGQTANASGFGAGTGGLSFPMFQ